MYYIHTYIYNTQINFQNSTLRNVPQYVAGWEHDFVVLKQYSENTMTAIALRRITDSHRNEIVKEICSRMINYCLYPTTKQQGIVAAKLVQAFPQLRDTSFTCGHVSSVRKQRHSEIIIYLVGIMGHRISKEAYQNEKACTRSN